MRKVNRKVNTITKALHIYEVTFRDSNKKLFEAKNIRDLVTILKLMYEQDDNFMYDEDDIVKIEERE